MLKIIKHANLDIIYLLMLNYILLEITFDDF